MNPLTKKTWEIAAIVLFLTNAITAGWLILSSSQKPAYESPYPLIDVARNFVPQEHFIVNIQPLREELRRIVEKEGSQNITLYFEFLNSGANIAINKDLGVWPASLAKVPVAMAVMKKIERGGWSLAYELAITEQDRDPTSGPLFKLSTGTKFSIERLTQEMLSRSDNTAYRILFRNISEADLQAVIDELGLDELFTADEKVSAKEYSRIFRALYTSSFLTRANSQKILEWLAESEFNGFLGSGLPKGIKFAHKWGENLKFGVYLDSGIVYAPNRPYLITVAIAAGTTSQDKERAAAIMKTISEKIYSYIAQN